MINPLPYHRAINIRHKIETVGSEPLLLICDDYEPYFVKNDKSNTTAVSMINEVLCHYFMRLWLINTPDICLVNLEPATLRENYGKRHNPSYYGRPAFGSKLFEGAMDATDFSRIHGKFDFRKYYRPEMFAHIGLFDMWVENDDRPTDLKNLMLFEEEDRYQFLAIDNARAFQTGEYQRLTDNEFWPTENAYMLQSQFFRELKPYLTADKEWCRNEKQNFYLCVSQCKRYFADICTQLPPQWGFTEGLKTILSNYLFNEQRNQQVFTEYTRMWK